MKNYKKRNFDEIDDMFYFRGGHDSCTSHEKHAKK